MYIFGIIVGLLLGAFIAGIPMDCKIREMKKFPLMLCDENSCLKKTRRITEFIDKRIDRDNIPANRELDIWAKRYGKWVYKEIDREKIEHMLSIIDESYFWWFPQFVRLVDMCGCKLVLVDKDALDRQLAGTSDDDET